MLRRFLLILAGALLITLAVSAVGLAETYSFGDVRAFVSVPDDFEMVLTPYNLGSNRDWLEQHGLDHDALSNSFDQEGVQLGKVLAKKVLAHETDGALKAYSDLFEI